MARYNLIQAPAVFLLETVFTQMWGFKPKMIGSFVRQKGAVRSLFWFAKNILKYEGIREKLGPVRTHVLVTGTSALNDCPYCVFGHGFALSLAHLKQTGQLFPMTESELMALCGQSESDILATMERALIQADLRSEVLPLERIGELRLRPELAATKQDRDLVALTKMFATLNFCNNQGNVQRDQAHDQLNKDRVLRDRYIALRRAARSQPAMTQSSGVTVLNPADVSDNSWPSFSRQRDD
ncbi:MAG: hypothetical protein AAFQ95_09150 [Cyanobacteria bacterium J06621_3]